MPDFPDNNLAGNIPPIIIPIDSHVKWLKFKNVCHELYQKILKQIWKIVTILIG